jgi:lipopolysaccharide O-acetyltransferase
LLELPLRVWGERRIEIGTDVFIGANCWFHVVEDTQTDQSTAINIGDGTSIAGGCTVTAARRVIIERHVLMARNVYVSDHSHAYSDHDRPIKDQGVTKIAPVRICEGAWLGQNVVVCPGVTIGRNAVVGANSVVRDDVPDFCVAVGAPARVIRRSDALLVGPSTASAHSSR